MSKKSLRIATWNIGSNKNYDAIAAKVAELDIDVCALQEVSLDPAVDLPAMFGRGLGDRSGYCRYFAPALAPEEFGGGKYEYFGLGMLSRIPLSRTAAFQLGPRHADSVINAENEPRILQIAVLPLEDPDRHRQHPSRRDRRLVAVCRTAIAGREDCRHAATACNAGAADPVR